MPNALRISGRVYPIRTDFRTGIEYQRMAAAGKLTAASLLDVWFPGEVPEDIPDAVEGISRFLRRKDAPAPDQDQDYEGPIPYDFTADADVIVSGFLSQYGIDLTAPNQAMHWWRFMALLEGLVAPNLARRIDIRTRDLAGMKSRERAQWLKLRQAYAIHSDNESVANHLAELDRIIAGHGGELHG